jgi:polysaccharide deacetylase family protein (PEP-CTERM system associated)
MLPRFVPPSGLRPPADAPDQCAILTVDLEDWNQLVARQGDIRDWNGAHTAFPRQVEALLSLLQSIGARATFFVLGVTAEVYGGAVSQVARCGHTIASHGHAHYPVWLQSRRAFREDLTRSIDVIGSVTGVRPVGYRAPAFSIGRRDLWAYEVLADLGFEYDSSQHDSPGLRDPMVPSQAGPHQLSLPSGRLLVEFPPAVLRFGPWRLPFGGGSYWRALPEAVVDAAIALHLRRGDTPTMYFHPYEFDPKPLCMGTGAAGARLRELRYNFRRSGVTARLSRLARQLPLITCEDYLEQHWALGAKAFS